MRNSQRSDVEKTNLIEAGKKDINGVINNSSKIINTYVQK